MDKALGFSHKISENVAKAKKLRQYYTILHLKMEAIETCKI
jgi:hypothetical protein